MKSNTLAFSASLIAVIAVSCMQPSQARGWRYAGPNGVAGARGGSYTGANGGTFAGGGGGFATRQAGLLGGAFKGTGANGGTAQGGGLAGWKQGVGGFEGTNMSAKGANGGTYNGSTRGQYNAQTGQGAYNGSHQVYDPQNGQTYGDTNQTTFTKGQGGTTQLDTNHNGDYQINYKPGQAPVVTPN
jgi:hypothetical protein